MNSTLNRDGSLGYVASDDQTYGLDGARKEINNPLLLAKLPEAGDYVVFATSAEADPEGIGNYELELETEEYLLAPIGYGASVVGAIAATDIHSTPGDLLDVYTFAGVQGETVRIEAFSSSFDPFVILNRNNGDFVAEDDNSGGGTVARLTVSLPSTGRYTILVTPFTPAKTGDYLLRLTRLGAAPASESGANETKAAGRFWGGNNNGLNSVHFAARRVIFR